MEKTVIPQIKNAKILSSFFLIAPLHQQDSPAKGFLSVSYIQILGAAEFPASPVLCHSPSFDPIGLFSIVRVYSPTVKAGIYPLASVTS